VKTPVFSFCGKVKDLVKTTRLAAKMEAMNVHPVAIENATVYMATQAKQKASTDDAAEAE